MVSPPHEALNEIADLLFATAPDPLLINVKNVHANPRG
jgi:hypothetical protein